MPTVVHLNNMFFKQWLMFVIQIPLKKPYKFWEKWFSIFQKNIVQYFDHRGQHHIMTQIVFWFTLKTQKVTNL